MLPIEESRLPEIRAELADHRGRVVEAAGQEVLVIRSPDDRPDLVKDLERSVVFLAEEDLQADMVVMVGAEKATKVQRDMIERKLEDRSGEEAKLVGEVEPWLGQPFDYALLRGGSRPDVLRLAVRIPKQYARDLSSKDLVHLRSNLLPIRDTSKGSGIEVVHVVAEQTRARMTADRFFADLEATAGADVGTGDVRQAVRARLEGRGYRVAEDPEAAGVDLAAEGDGRKLLVRFAEAVDSGDVRDLERTRRRLGADVLLVVSGDVSEAARRDAMATAVEPVGPGDVEDLPL